MNRFLSVIFLVLAIQAVKAFATAPKDTFYLEPGETYVVKLKIIEKVWEDKCYCPTNGSQCTLFYVSVSEILYLPTNAFLNRRGLSQIKYMSFPEEYIKSINFKKEFTVSLIPSASESYLSIRRIINVLLSAETEFRYKGQAMYYGSKFTCKKRRPWPFRVFYSKKNKYIMSKDPFEEPLSNYEKSRNQIKR